MRSALLVRTVVVLRYLVPRGSWRGWLRPVGSVIGALTLLMGSLWLAVRIAPMQSVTAVGQTVEVGAASPGLSLSGPGELDLFGQTIATRPHFAGPVRPRLRLTHITPDAEVAQLFGSGSHGELAELGRRLAAGWLRYGLWEIAVSTGIVVVVLAAVTGLRRCSLRRTGAVLLSGIVAMSAVNVLGFYLLASSTPPALRHVHSLSDLVGHSALPMVPSASGPTLGKVTAVVMGDSTAAGVGNRPLANPTALDKACERSADSFARQLAEVNNWDVLNLACSGATIRQGLIGEQRLGDLTAAPQLAQLQRASHARVVIVSIGANDLHWADLTRLCAASPSCDDRATDAYFEQQMARFALDYHDLLAQLAALPERPHVIINQYYDPFGPNTACLANQGITNTKVKALELRLSQLNTALRQGADAAGFTTVQPSFAGHTLCSPQPFVQGPTDRAPLHPTAAGELAIALADQQALPIGSSG
jgi:lysophospholipase L1-like esterase